MAEFKSKSQISIGVGGRRKPPGASYRNERTYDRMMKHPTIQLAMDIITALALQQPWTVEGVDTERCNFIWTQIEPYRKKIIRSSLRGFVRHGWRLFEVKYDVAQVPGAGLRQTLDGVKAIKPSKMDLVVDPETAELVGCVVRDAITGQEVFIDANHMAFINNDDDGYGEFADPLLEIARESYDKWNVCEEGAERYDEKVAGGFLQVKYPVGSTPYSKKDGADEDNSIIADDMAQSIRAAGYCTIPINIDDSGATPQIIEAWKSEYIASAGGLQPSFTMRAKYLDAMMLRTFGIPERSTTEGTLGTKAEAEAHADIGIMANVQRAEKVADAINEQVVQPLNISNWGDPGACMLKLGKLDPDDRVLFQAIFTGLMADPILTEQVTSRIDVEALLDKLGVPTRQETAFSEVETEA